MRDLTPEELALAPDWATHYSLTSFGELCFVDLKNKIVTSATGIKRDECPISCGNWFDGVDLPEIPRKPFDITQHEWSDNRISFAFDGDGINIKFTEEYEEFVKSVYFPNKHDVELLQYTGLKDKNGKEIYEGDIISGRSKVFSLTVGQVVFSEYSDCEEYMHKCHLGWNVNGIPLKDLVCDGLEVIGNIYENPELVNGEV